MSILTEQKYINCKYSVFLLELHNTIKDCNLTNNEKHWIETSIFVELHDGKEYCNCIL